LISKTTLPRILSGIGTFNAESLSKIWKCAP
jgi:hypothetical protein